MSDDLPPLVIESAAQHRALAHPVRHRLIMTLRGESATISQLARRLEIHKGSVAHHLNLLVDAGIARVGETRQVRGGTEKYYELTVGMIRTREDDAASTAAMLSAVAGELSSDSQALLHLRHVRLTDEQVAALRAALETIVAEAPSTDGAPVHAVMVGLYRTSS